MTLHMGSNFDDFLSDDDLLGDCELVSQDMVSDYVSAQEDTSKVIETLKKIHYNLIEDSKSLDPEAERVLRDNLWDLYGS